MIPIAYINEWRQQAPWQDDYQVEQDLIICRALTAIYITERKIPSSLKRGWDVSDH